MKKSNLLRCGGVLLSVFLTALASAHTAPAPAPTPAAASSLAVVPGTHVPEPRLLAAGGTSSCRKLCFAEFRTCIASGQLGCEDLNAECVLACIGTP